MSKIPRIGSQGFASHGRTQAPEGRGIVATGGARNERNPWIVGGFLAIFSSFLLVRESVLAPTLPGIPSRNLAELQPCGQCVR